VSSTSERRRNRVRPDGQLIAVPDRGMLWGNRGQLLDDHGRLSRHSRGRNWIICQLEFHGRHRTQWQPRRLTELYFLDEATALAAGHRPCGECRLVAYRAFTGAWAAAHPADPVGAAHIDARLHADRLASPGCHRTFAAPLASLPDGVLFEAENQYWLVLGPELLAWSPGGYRHRRARPDLAIVAVATPRATVAALTAGYQPQLHPSVHHIREATA